MTIVPIWLKFVTRREIPMHKVLAKLGALVGAEWDESLWQQPSMGVFEVSWMETYFVNSVQTTFKKNSLLKTNY